MKKQRETHRPFVLVAVILAMFMAAVEATIVATAVPGIVADLGGFSLFSWVFSAYLLMQVIMIPIYGKLSDLFGRKLIFSIGIFIFLIGSLLCGFASTMELLIVYRFIQGLGAGAVQPIATTIVGDMYTKEERAKIQGYLASVWGISAILGPVLGAVFIKYLHWAWIFWINIPFGVLAMLGVIFFLNESIEKRKRYIDYPGALLLLIGVSSLMLILIQGGVRWAWNSGPIILLVLTSLFSFVLFILQESRAKEPMMTLSLWKQKGLRYANIASFTSGAMLLAISSFLPTYVQGVLNQSPLIAGLTLTAISIGWPVSSTIAGKLMLKIGFRMTAVIGGTALLVGSICYLMLPIILHPVWAGMASFFIGVGMGFATTTFVVSIQTTVSWNVRGEATAMNMFMRSLGGAVGVAFLGGLLNSRLQQYLSQFERELSFAPTLDAVNSLLETGQDRTLPSIELEILQAALSSGLGAVFLGICFFAILSFILVLLLPKDNLKQNRDN
ncbi:MDR family MFS transporter [Halalkalibacter urbisdiaboli]|uniref:MDR family MFS transporter n=1 Tax=Halalkalibacter urbisdiaboli TaxID=1960589 RepID=UPI002477DFF4|nr:MDR family MFS transporter [Halalkalibacter urbisdiaboli]